MATAKKITKKKEDTYTFFTMTAKHQGWQINTDKEFVDMLAEGLTTNYNRYGYYLCPCRDTNGTRDKDKDVICPCQYSKPDIAEYGHCYCGLYCDPKFLAAGKLPKAIPERRPF